MEKRRIVILLVTISLCLPVFVFADTIVLKSGKTIEGKIIEKTDNYVRIDSEGAPLTYPLDQIKNIEGVQSALSSEGKEVKINVNISDPNIAVGYYEAAIKDKPNDFSAYNKLGMAYAGLNQLQKALECFQKATEINPDFAQSYAYVGLTYNSLKQPENALPFLKKAIDLGCTDIQAYAGLAASYYFTDKFPESIVYFEKVVQIDPKDIQAYIALGNAYKKTGDYQKARANFLKVKELYSQQGSDTAAQKAEELADSLPK